MTISPGTDNELQGAELWRRQNARNLMDCYALGMQRLMERPGDRVLAALVGLMVDGMTAARGEEDERAFYRMAAELCRGCAEGESGRMFRIYAAIFDDQAGRLGREP